MTPVDEAVGVLRSLASQVKGVEAHCVELRTDTEEGAYLSLEYLCGDLALWVQVPLEEPAHIDETGRAWVTAQIESIALAQPLGITRLVQLAQRLQGLFPSLHADVSVRNRGDQECLVEAEWFGEIEPSGGESGLFASVAGLLREMRLAVRTLEEALQDAEHMQQAEDRVAGLLLGADHPGPRKRPGGPGRRRRSRPR